MTRTAATWADAEFNKLEAAYDEADRYKREADELREALNKATGNWARADAKIRELQDALNEVAEKWAIAQVNYEEEARNTMHLKALLKRLMTCVKYPWCDGCPHVDDDCDFDKYMAALGIEVDE